MGKSSPKRPVFGYKMSIMLGWCFGPAGKIHRLWFKEKLGYEGSVSGGKIFVDNVQLFGGLAKEGGVQGHVYLQMGSAMQKLAPEVATKIGGTPDTLPGNRGLVTMTFVEGDDGAFPAQKTHPAYDGPGFYWSEGQPYIPPVWAQIERIGTPAPLFSTNARILRDPAAGFDGTERLTVGVDNAPVWATHEKVFVDWNRRVMLVAENDPFSPDTFLLVYDLDTLAYVETLDLTIGLAGKMNLMGFDPETGYLVGGHKEIGEPFWQYVYDPVGKALITEVNAEASYNVVPTAESVVDETEVNVVVTHPDSGAAAVLSHNVLWISVHTFPALVFQNHFHTPAGRYDIGTNGDDWSPGGFQNGRPGEGYGLWRAADETRIYRYEISAGGSISETHIGTIAVADVGVASFNHLGNTPFLHYDPETHSLHFVLTANGAPADSIAVGWDLNAEALAYSSAVDVNDNAFGTAPWNTRLSAGYWVYQPDGIDSYFQAIEIATGDAQQITISGDLTLGGPRSVWDGVSNCMWSLNDLFTGSGNQRLDKRCFSDGVDAIYDMNPAHIIVECLTNAMWGIGQAPTAVDATVFRDAADTLYRERFGLSMIWTRSTTIEKFVKEVLDHIEAALFIDPKTGLFSIKLIRDDYDESSLRTLGPHNITLDNFNRRHPTESINEIVVTWTNPENEKEETVTIQDLGAIVAAGRINSDSRNYYGVHKPDLASSLAARDIRSGAAPVAATEGQAKREFWDVTPGEPLKLFYPEFGIPEDDPIIVRAMAVDYGKPGAPAIKLKLSEDIFSLTAQAVETAPSTGLPNQTVLPSVANDHRVLTLPYFMAYNLVDPAVSSGVVYPDVFCGVLVAETDKGVVEFDLYGEVSDATGGSTLDLLGGRDIVAQGTLPFDFPWEAQTAVSSWGTVSNGGAPEVGGFVLIGGDSGTEETMELCLLSGFASGTWTVVRGVLDTVPRAWPSGTKVWFLGANIDIHDNTPRAPADTLDYKATPRASGGTLPISDAPLLQHTPTERPWLPLRPADVKINGLAFQDVYYTTKPANVDLTWADRNRETENAVVLGWTEPGITPETNQTVEVDLLDEGLVLLNTITGLTGGSASIPEVNFNQVGKTVVRVYAERDGLRSLQYYEALVDTRGGIGYGEDYGNDYGGTAV